MKDHRLFVILQCLVCYGVMEQGAGERRGEGVTVFGNRMLERGKERG